MKFQKAPLVSFNDGPGATSITKGPGTTPSRGYQIVHDSARLCLTGIQITTLKIPILIWEYWFHYTCKSPNQCLEWEGVAGGDFFKTNRQRHISKVKRRREKIENKRFKRGKRGKGTSSNRDRTIFRGSPRRRRGGGLDKYTPLHWMTGILISHLPPGEIEGAEQGWSCHLNPSSPLILHHHPSLHLSACSSSTPAQGCHLNPASLIASIQPPEPSASSSLSLSFHCHYNRSLSRPKWHVTAIIALWKERRHHVCHHFHP